MFHSFADIEQKLISDGVCKTIALCGAHDKLALEALVEACGKGIAKAVLIGDEELTRAALVELGEDPSDYTIIDEPDGRRAARKAVDLVYREEADIPMKGLVHTHTYLEALSHPIKGVIPPEAVLNLACIFYYPDREKFLVFGDGAVNIQPTVEEKRQIALNLAKVAASLDNPDVKVGVISAVEEVNPDIVSTVHAQELSEMEWPEGITVDGPFALDNALSKEAALHKGIEKEIAGEVDVLLLPDLVSGNVLYKSLSYIAHRELASVFCGTTKPVILTSRTDPPKNKYASLLMAIQQSCAEN